MITVSMYVDMLSSALEAWDMELRYDALLDNALDCRVRMLATGTAHGASAYQALAAELAYDRALILLCGDVGIRTSPDCFDQPYAERTRLERSLAGTSGINLVALSRGRHEEMGQPSLAGAETSPRR